jgi:hypothetical protein
MPVHGTNERQVKPIAFKRYWFLVNPLGVAHSAETRAAGFAVPDTANTLPRSRFRYAAYCVLSFLKLDPRTRTRRRGG